MLVYAKNPDGIMKVGNKRVYGRNLSQGPVNLSFPAYNASKDDFVHATYRKSDLLLHFPGPFDIVAFTYDELKCLPRKTLRMLCRGMRIPYHYTHSIKRVVGNIKTALRQC
jgi:hypothetical protein